VKYNFGVIGKTIEHPAPLLFGTSYPLRQESTGYDFRQQGRLSRGLVFHILCAEQRKGVLRGFEKIGKV
jgi:hypothetical protein